MPGQDINPQPAKSLGITDQLYIEHLVIPDRETKGHYRPAVSAPHAARYAIEQRKLSALSLAAESSGDRIGTVELRSNPSSAQTHGQRRLVGSQSYVRIEQCQQRSKVAAA